MSNYYPPPGYFPPVPQGQRHSGLGIASFILSMLAGVGMCGAMAVATMMAAKAGGGQIDEQSPQAIGLGCSILGCGLIALVSIGLGIAGVMQAERRKIFAILGLVFSAGMVVAVVGVMVVGLMAKGV